MSVFRMFVHFVVLLFLGVLSAMPFSAAVAQQAQPQVMIVLDASGSMWGKSGGTTKINAARSVLKKVVPGIPQEVSVGLTAYGHRRKGDCKDIEVIYQAENTDRQALLRTVDALNPKGETPIAASLSVVVNRLKGSEKETTIILVSDGNETCDKNPCAVVRELKVSGINFVMHVVGFDVNAAQKQQLDCIARAGGGRYFSASDTASLLAAMQAISREVKAKAEKARTTVTAVSSGLGTLKITMPQESLASLNTMNIVRVADRKLVKTIEDPVTDSSHPLPAGTYELIGGYANSNYKPDSEMSMGTCRIEGEKTTRMAMGAMAIDISPTLASMPAGAVIITRQGGSKRVLTTPETGNTYYFYKTKPLPPGTYVLAVHYKGSYLYRTGKQPVILQRGVIVKPGAVSKAVIDTGIQLQKSASSDVTAWALARPGSSVPVMKIQQASNGDYPLWLPYAIASGTYDVLLYMKGMSEPLVVKKRLVIPRGSLIKLSTGI